MHVAAIAMIEDKQETPEIDNILLNMPKICENWSLKPSYFLVGLNNHCTYFLLI